MIIGIAGYKGAGKDTVANVLQTSFGFEKMSFAQPIKDLIHQTFGIDKAILSGNCLIRSRGACHQDEAFENCLKQPREGYAIGFRRSLLQA